MLFVVDLLFSAHRVKRIRASIWPIDAPKWRARLKRSLTLTRRIGAASAAACAPRTSSRSRTRSISRAQSAPISACICHRVCRTKVCESQVSALCTNAAYRRDARSAEQRPREERRRCADAQKRRPPAQRVLSAAAVVQRRFSVSLFALLLYRSSSTCRLLSHVVQGDYGQYVILGRQLETRGHKRALCDDARGCDSWLRRASARFKVGDVCINIRTRIAPLALILVSYDGLCTSSTGSSIDCGASEPLSTHRLASWREARHHDGRRRLQNARTARLSHLGYELMSACF